MGSVRLRSKALLGFVPTLFANRLELGSSEPSLGRSARESEEILLASKAPGIGTCRINIVAPEESNAMVAGQQQG
jgi:hypothetical protein